MKANELRIGNYIRFFNMIKPAENVQVTARFFSMLANGRPESEMKDSDELNGYCSGIPLTPEILEKCGMKDCDDFAAEWTYIKHIDGEYFLICDHLKVSNKPIVHLHQLQNLYFALTGEELGIIF